MSKLKLFLFFFNLNFFRESLNFFRRDPCGQSIRTSMQNLDSVAQKMVVVYPQLIIQFKLIQFGQLWKFQVFNLMYFQGVIAVISVIAKSKIQKGNFETAVAVLLLLLLLYLVQIISTPLAKI